MPKQIKTVIVAKILYDFIGIMGLMKQLKNATADVSEVTNIYIPAFLKM
jgi:hypothetical protein